MGQQQLYYAVDWCLERAVSNTNHKKAKNIPAEPKIGHPLTWHRD